MPQASVDQFLSETDHRCSVFKTESKKAINLWRLFEITFISKKVWKNIMCYSENCHFKKIFGLYIIIKIWASFYKKKEIGFLVDFCKNFMDILWLFFGYLARLWLGNCSVVVSHNLSMKIYQNSTKIGFLFQGKIKVLPRPWAAKSR